MTKPIRMWAGFSDGKLDRHGVVNHQYEYYHPETGSMIQRARSAAIFTSRKEARRQYKDVRRVTVREE